MTISDEIIEISGRHYVRSTAYLHDTESDAYVQNSAYAREEENKKGMDASQVTGSASSYARKYVINVSNVTFVRPSFRATGMMLI